MFRERAIEIKEQRSDLVKHHLWVLWTDYFKPPHFEKYPELHELFNKATKAAGAAGTKGSNDPSTGQALLDYIAQINTVFWETNTRGDAVIPVLPLSVASDASQYGSSVPSAGWAPTSGGQAQP